MRSREIARTAMGLVALAIAALGVSACQGDESGQDRGQGVRGAGYELYLPAGWTAAGAGQSARSKRWIQDATGAQLTVLVDATARPDSSSREYARRLRRQARRDVRRLQRVAPEVGASFPDGVAPIAIDGEEAAFFEASFETPQEGGEAASTRRRVVGAVHSGSAYSITVGAPAPSFDAALSDLKAILDSWRWRD